MGDSFQIEWKSNERTYQLPDQPTNQLDDKSDFLIVSKHVFLRAGPRTLTNKEDGKGRVRIAHNLLHLSMGGHI